MRITDLLSDSSINLHANPKSKLEAIDELVTLMSRTGNLKNVEEYKQRVWAREKEGTTGIGEGVAIPHAKTNVVLRPGLSAIVVQDGVDFDSLDGTPAMLLFLIAAPDTNENVHLDVLARLSVLLMNDKFRQSLINAKNSNEFRKLIDQAETCLLYTSPSPRDRG